MVVHGSGCSVHGSEYVPDSDKCYFLIPYFHWPYCSLKGGNTAKPEGMYGSPFTLCFLAFIIMTRKEYSTASSNTQCSHHSWHWWGAKHSAVVRNNVSLTTCFTIHHSISLPHPYVRYRSPPLHVYWSVDSRGISCQYLKNTLDICESCASSET